MNTAYPALQQAFEKLILSASGWRKVFAQSGLENDDTHNLTAVDRDIAFFAAQSFSAFLHRFFPRVRTIVVARDSRPTGAVLLQEAVRACLAAPTAQAVQSIGIAAAPEVMAYTRSINAAFIYISASHNPIGHNGFKFGLNTGGVLNGEQSAQLITLFTETCAAVTCTAADAQRKKVLPAQYDAVFTREAEYKQAALTAYETLLYEVVSGTQDTEVQVSFFDGIKSRCAALAKEGTPFTLVADFNGSARAASIDRHFFESLGMRLTGIAEKTGEIKHGIIPEGENLTTCAEKIEALHRDNPTQAENTLFGYMPDCDGDRGNIIYWDEAQKKALTLDAQEVFALSIVSELSHLHYRKAFESPLAITVNGPTSLRINEIAKALETEVFYAEVGEANVVNRAHDARKYGYTVRILGEGSNGGNITYPEAVRDPLNTLFAIIKFLLIKDMPNTPCPFRIWCEKSGQIKKYRKNFTFADIVATLPQYRTTPTQEKRALLHIQTKNHNVLKSAYQTIFLQEWAEKKNILKNRFGIEGCKVFSYNGTVCTENPKDFALSGRGGLKIQFYSKEHTPIAFIWMRGSGTEPVFRIMADIKSCKQTDEEFLVHWQADMVNKADRVAIQKESI